MKKAKGFGNGIGGGKHRKSGVSHNQSNSIARAREENERIEKETELKKKKKGKMYNNVKDLLFN